MKAKKLVIGTMYYCLIGDYWPPEFAIVKAKYINNAGYPYNHDLVFMEQKIDGVIHQFQADAGKIYPLNKAILSAVLHNERQGRRILEHPKQFDHKNAREKIGGWIATLPESDQKALRSRFREVYPQLVKPDGAFLSSKFKMEDWNEVMHLYFNIKFPRVSLPVKNK